MGGAGCGANRPLRPPGGDAVAAAAERGHGALGARARRAERAGLDEGIVLFSYPILVCMHNPGSDST